MKFLTRNLTRYAEQLEYVAGMDFNRVWEAGYFDSKSILKFVTDFLYWKDLSMVTEEDIVDIIVYRYPRIKFEKLEDGWKLIMPEGWHGGRVQL